MKGIPTSTNHGLWGKNMSRLASALPRRSYTVYEEVAADEQDEFDILVSMERYKAIVDEDGRTIIYKNPLGGLKIAAPLILSIVAQFFVFFFFW